jgi:hypothetical protein
MVSVVSTQENPMNYESISYKTNRADPTIIHDGSARGVLNPSV